VKLVEAVGPARRVTGLDLCAELLAVAESVAREAGLSDRIFVCQGDVRELPFDDESFDWAWSVDCVGYAPMQPLPLVKELARVVKPGGSVTILAWSSEKLLPGYPLLEARLNATASGIAPFAEGRRPKSHFLSALSWLDDAGLKELAAQTFVGDAHAPLTDEARRALIALFEMRWPGVEAELANGDALDRHLLAEYRRLCLPESRDFIVDSPGYYAFFTYSMFLGRVAERRAAVGEVSTPR
jgi:demethylmenaquinone methyltransferase/2-methoxy-6-polyprenyl-1,4-benzoquinol methylase